MAAWFKLSHPRAKNLREPILFSMTRSWVFPVSVALVLFLLFSAGCVSEQAGQKSPKAAPDAHHDAMRQTLSWVTGTLQGSLSALDSAVAGAAADLAKTGLSGPEADEILSRAAASDPSVINIITYDRNGTVLAAEPAAAKVLVGQDISDHIIVRETLASESAVMSPLVMLAAGVEGVIIAHPVTSPDGQFLGMASLAFSPYGMVAPVADATVKGTPYTVMVNEPGGLILYDADPGQVGQETFSSSLFAEYPEIFALARNFRENRTGYGTYTFSPSPHAAAVKKETFWDTVGLHGREWRVFVIRAM